MTDRNISIVIMRAEQLAAITIKLTQLEWQAAGYERLKAACERQKGRITELENRVAIYRDVDRQYGAIERQSEMQQEENARLRMTADALEERVALQEQQLEAADILIKELQAALVLKNLPDGSLDNVLQMAKAA